MTVLSYLITSGKGAEEGDGFSLLRVGKIENFLDIWAIQKYLEFIQEERPGCENILLDRCLVRLHSPMNGSREEHRLDGPALLVSDILSGHTYVTVFAHNGYLHNENGAALIFDDGETVYEEYHVEGKRISHQIFESPNTTPEPR